VFRTARPESRPPGHRQRWDEEVSSQRLGLAPPSRTFPLSAVAAETTRNGKLGLAPPNRTFPESSLAASDGRTDGVAFRAFFL